MSAAAMAVAGPQMLAACRQALALIRSHWPIEHGQRDVGEAWGALVAAIDAAAPPFPAGARALYRPDGSALCAQLAIVQRAYLDADTGDRDYTIWLPGEGHSVTGVQRHELAEV